MAPEPGPPARKAAAAVAAGLVGVVVGLAAGIVHRQAVRPADVLVPWGLVLALATMFAVTVVAGRIAQGPGAIGVAVGWVVTLLMLQQVRPEGDYIFASDFLGNAYVFGGMLTIVLAVVRGMTVPMRESPRS